MRSRLLVLAVACTVAPSIFAAAPSSAQISVRLELPSQPLDAALRYLGNQTRTNILFDPASVKNIAAPAVTDAANVEEALAKILVGSGLTYRFIDARTVTLVPADTALAKKTSLAMPRESSSGRIHLAQAKTPTSASQGVGSGEDQSEDQDQQADEMQAGSPKKLVGLEEIIVTAQKREERLQDVPVPVTVISGDVLVDRNQMRIEDYFTSVPGFSFATGNFGEPHIAIRGVVTQLTNPGVGITVDDLPYGASSSLAGGYAAPDLDPSDMKRIEVLRGPQGTLYGASSIGGLLKYVTIDPSTDGISARVQAGTSAVHNGSDLGSSVRGAINLPLSDELAIRLSAFTRHDPGYVDNIRTGERGVNSRGGYGGRLSALWQISQDFSLKLGAALQDLEGDGAPYVNAQAGLGDLEQSNIPGTGFWHTKPRVYSAVVTGDLGAVDLTSVSGYSISQFRGLLDRERTAGAQGLTGEEHAKNKKFSQEVRLLVPIGEHFEWLVGGFYNEENSEYTITRRTVNPATGVPTGPASGVTTFIDSPSKYTEYAAFTDLIWKLTDRFDVQVGGRTSKIRQSLEQTTTTPSSITTRDTVRTNEDAFTFLFTPRFKITSDLIAYARFASGYRPGGPNFNAIPAGLPPQYDPDRTINYEVGIKGSILNDSLSFDASLYRIDWEDIQILVVRNGTIAYGNGSQAKSEGVEISVETRPLSGLSVSAWAAYNTAKITEDFPPGSFPPGRTGDRIPDAPRTSGQLSIDQEIPFSNTWVGFVGATANYVGNRAVGYRAGSATPPISRPGYTQADIRGGLRYGSWEVNAFVTNVTDKRGVLSSGGVNYRYVTYVQPRTAGVSVTKTF